MDAGQGPGDAPVHAPIATLEEIHCLSSSMLSVESRDEILRLAASSVPAGGGSSLLGIYLAIVDDGQVVDHVPWSGPAALVPALNDLGGADGPLDGRNGRCAWATSMFSLGTHEGYLVVSADAEPEPPDRFLLSVLAQSTATALVVGERTGLVLAADEAKMLASARLEASVNELKRRTQAHELMTDAAVHGQASDLARTAYSLTRLPVAIVDQFGHLQTSAGDNAAAEVWNGVRMPTRRELASAADAGTAIRFTDAVVAAARPGNDVLGGVLLLDVDRCAGDFELYVLERAAALLTGQLAHRLALAEMEMRLRRDLVVELVEGIDEEEACARAALFGHDLDRPHQVAVIRCDAEVDQTWVESALRQAGSPDDAHPVVGRRRGLHVAILDSGTGAARLHEALKQSRGELPSSVGVGEPAVGPAAIPRSYAQALKALRVRGRSPEPDGGTDFSELGIYQILEDTERDGAVDRFVRRWLGALIDYDESRNSELVNTVAHFLDCGGSYDLTAQALLIHRSTLRYRLRRIRDLGGFDLGDVDTRLNVHVATRAWRVMGTS